MQLFAMQATSAPLKYEFLSKETAPKKEKTNTMLTFKREEKSHTPT